MVARPNADVRKRVEEFCAKAAAFCPGQHFYKPANCTDRGWRYSLLGSLARGIHPAAGLCRMVLDEVLKIAAPFIEIPRLTVSPEQMLVQGFPQDDNLARLRDELRSALRSAGWAKNLEPALHNLPRRI